MANVYPLDLGQNYRKSGPPSRFAAGDDNDVVVTIDSGAGGGYDPDTDTTQTQLSNGDLEVAMGPPPRKANAPDDSFDANLAEHLSDGTLAQLSDKLLRGIEADDQSRAGWLENMSEGLSLLGLEIKPPRGAAASGGNPQEGTSTVDHPLLLEADLRFQANARGELLPSDGPVKVQDNSEGNALSTQLAEALEKDLNHYLVNVATEYVPDTDRMLLLLGFCGIGFKKGYHDPIKRRPVIASIDAKDLIVSHSATNLEGCGRVTHRIMMRPSLIKRMQLVGAYRDVPLSPPGMMPLIPNVVDAKIQKVQGIAPAQYTEPEDQEREFFETYCEIEIPGFEHELDGELTGLPLPYKVTIDKESRHILEIRRNWDEDDEFCMPINRIVAYTFIPGFGFYGIGLLNVLGNSTRAVTAAWRLMIDAGMFANFPGFLYIKAFAKQLTNQFRVSPGAGLAIDTTGNDLTKAVMPLPYKDPSPVFIQLIENIATQAQRVGGTAELQVGEGKQDAPVGTTLAMIEQATKLMSAVHKRLHHAQAVEFKMLKELLMEDPEALWRHNKKSKVLKLLMAQNPELAQMGAAQDQAEERHRLIFVAALNDFELIPRADPNTSSQTERYLKVVAMRTMAQTNPAIDVQKVDQLALQVMGVADGDSYFKPPPDPSTMQPSPEQMTAQATMMAAQARISEAQTNAQNAQTKAQLSVLELAGKQRVAQLGVNKELVIHQSDQDRAARESLADNQQRAADRMHELALAREKGRSDAAAAGAERGSELAQQSMQLRHEAIQNALNRRHEFAQGVMDRRHEMAQNVLDRRHKFADGVLDRRAKLAQGVIDRGADLVQGVMDRQHEAAQQHADRLHEATQNEAERRYGLASDVVGGLAKVHSAARPPTGGVAGNQEE